MTITQNENQVWYKKYRPTSISNFIFHDDTHRKPIIQMIEKQSINHLLFSGIQGSGKTAIALILMHELHVDPFDILFINSSDENSVDDIRDNVKSFISTYATGALKVVIFDEADYLSLSAQAILRNMIDSVDESVRFIFTCNYENKIINPLKSRLQQFRFKALDINDITELTAKILVAENIAFDLDLLDSYIAIGYPDIRKIINLLQQNSINGKLIKPISSSSDGADYKFNLLNCIEKDTWEAARNLVCENVLGEEWYDVYTFLYNNLHKSKKFQPQNNWEEGMLIIAEHAYKHELVADKVINASAMFIRLTMVGK